MGATKYWSRKKKSRAEKGNQRKKSSTENVKGNSSGTSSSPNHLGASDGSCLDVCTCKKGHFSPVKAWNPTPERTTSPSDTQKDIRSEAPFQKYKNSTAQLKPSLNVRTNSSQQDIKSATPAVNNKLSAVKLKPSPDLSHSPEPPGITKTEIPLLSKKFQVINRLPSDSRIFKYNESVISSPNSSPGSTGKLVVGSPFSSPTSLIGLNGTRKTAIQSRDITGTSKTSMESIASLYAEPFESRVVSPFGRKFSSRGLFSAAQNQKKGTAESKKSFNEKDQVLVKNLDIVDPPIENKILEREQSDSIIKISPSPSPLSQPVSKLTHNMDQTKNLCVQDAVAEKKMLDSIQTDVQSHISPSISLVSRPTVKFTDDNDGAKILHVNDAETENNMLDHSQICPSTIQLSELVDEFTRERNEPPNLHVADAETKKEVLEPMNGKIQISPSTSPLSKLAIKLPVDKDQVKNLHVDNVKADNIVLESVQADGHMQVSPSTAPLSHSDGKLTNDNDQVKLLYTVDVASKNEMLEQVQTDAHSHISPSASHLSEHGVTFAHHNDMTNILHVNDTTTKNEKLELVQINDHSQISLSTSPLSQPSVKLTHENENDQTKIFHVGDANEMLESDGHTQISTSISPLSMSTVKLTHDDDRAKILHVVERTENEMLEPVQTDGHIQNSHSTSSFFQSQVLSDAHSEPLPCHADELAEPEYTDAEIEELYEDIDVEALENFEYIYSYDSEDSEFAEETDEINLENVDVVNINKVNTAIGMHHKNPVPDKGKQYTSEDKDFCKCKFRRGSIVDLQSENDVPRKLKFRRGRVVENENGTKTYVGRRRFQIREIADNANANSPNSKYSDSDHSEDSGYGDGGTDGFKPESGDGVHISRSDTLKGKHHRNSRDDKQFSSEGGHLAYKRKFRRGRIVGLQSENEVPINLKFRRGRVVEDNDGTKTCVGKIRYKKREIVGNMKTAGHDSEYIDNYYSEDSEYTESELIEFSSENDDFLNINRVDGYHKNPREGEKFTSKEYSPAYKCKFRRGRIVDPRTENDIPRRLKFRRGRVIENEDGTKTYVERIRLKKRETVDNTNTTSPGSEYIDSYYSDGSEYTQSETVEFNPENGEAASIDKVEMLQGKHHINPRKGKQFIMEEDSPAYKCKFRRGRIVNLQMDNDVPRRLKFRRGRIIENEDGTKTYVRRRRFEKREIVDNVNATSPDSEKVVLRHQEMQEKKDELCLFNDVIEETVTILSKSRKSKVKALVGAFETVISLQDDRTPPGELSRSPLLTPQ